MDKAKAAVSDFMHKSGTHKTSVDQDTNAAVTQEQVRPQRHEEITTAVDKEIHQDHHQTIVQPIHHTETLPEKHVHNAAAVQHKHFDHDNADTARAHEADLAKFRDTSVTHDTVETASAAPTVQGEQVHHHLHQHVQPVIHKQVVAPEVVHTTIPIHETHKAPTVNHGTTTLPAKTLAEFQKEMGSSEGLMKGRPTENVGEFDGCAKDVVQGDHHHAGHAGQGVTGHMGSGLAGDTDLNPSRHSGMVNKAEHTHGTGLAGDIDNVPSRQSGMVNKPHSPAAAAGSGDYAMASQAASHAHHNHAHDATPRTADGTHETGKKPSIVDKLNPFKDSDGDGKKGLMS